MIKQKDVTSGYWWVHRLDYDGNRWVGKKPNEDVYMVEVRDNTVFDFGSELYYKVENHFKDGKPSGIEFLYKVEDYKDKNND